MRVYRKECYNMFRLNNVIQWSIPCFGCTYCLLTRSRVSLCTLNHKYWFEYHLNGFGVFVQHILCILLFTLFALCYHCVVPFYILVSKRRWMPFPERVTYQKAIQMFKTIRVEAPDNLKTSFTFSLDVHTKLLRPSSIYTVHVPKPNFRHTFVLSGSSM